jgi:hypothetical protein
MCEANCLLDAFVCGEAIWVIAGGDVMRINGRRHLNGLLNLARNFRAGQKAQKRQCTVL